MLKQIQEIIPGALEEMLLKNELNKPVEIILRDYPELKARDPTNPFLKIVTIDGNGKIIYNFEFVRRYEGMNFYSARAKFARELAEELAKTY